MAFVLPSLAGVAVFYVIPYAICLYRSFTVGDKFVGLGNYLELFSNYTFRLALANTAIFTLTAIPLLMLLSFAIAMFLNSFGAIASFFRSVLLVPVIIPAASLISVWQAYFEDYGAINGILNSLGMDKAEFFGSGLSMVMIILIFIWKHCGFCVILFSAGLAAVPKTYIESAKLEGAGRLRVITRIILPGIRPTTFFVLLMSLIYSFRIHREVFALFGDYPDEHVYLLQNFVNNNYYNLNYPRLSAASIILSAFVVIVLLVFFRFERRSEI